MSHQRCVGIALVIGLAAIAADWHSFAAEEKGERGPGAATAKARRDAAKKVYEGSWQRHVQDPENGHGDVEYYHDWSVRWMQAERDFSHTKAEHVTALEGHLKRMRVWKEMFDGQVKEGQNPVYEAQAAEFFRLEAEDWLAAVR